MANLFSLYTTLLLLSTSSALMGMVASDTCKEETGSCSYECNTACEMAHLGITAYGLCESGGDGEHCWCYYDCPPRKTSPDGFIPNGECSDQSCDAECTSRHPGQAAQGYCYNLVGTLLYACRCTYFC